LTIKKTKAIILNNNFKYHIFNEEISINDAFLKRASVGGMEQNSDLEDGL